MSAWRQLPRLRDPAAFDGWLNRIVANAALMARRHRVRLREVSVRPAYPGDETPQPEPPQDPQARTAMDEFVDNDAIGAGVRPAAAAGPDDPRPPPRRGAAGRRDRAVARDPRRNRQVATARCPHARSRRRWRPRHERPTLDRRPDLPGPPRPPAGGGCRPACASASSTRPRPPPSCGRCPRSSVPSATRTRSAADGACSSPPRSWSRWRSRVPRRSGRCASSSGTPSTN